MDKLKTVVASHFDDKALNKQSYFDKDKLGAKSNNEYLRSPYEYIENIILEKINKKKVLDYCCGMGEYSLLPALHGCELHGMDISKKSIDIATQRAEQLGVSQRCTFSVMDAEKLDYQDNYFDIVLSYGSLSYLNRQIAYKELCRVLKPDGTLIVVDSLGHNPIFNFNRRKNIKRYASNYHNSLKTLRVKDYETLGKNFAHTELKYFDFLSTLGYLLHKGKIAKISPKILNSIDAFILRIPLLNRLSFKCVGIFRIKKEEV